MSIIRLNTLKVFCTILAVMCISACEPTIDRQTLVKNAQSATPSDPHLAEIYNRSCRACHATQESTAPLVGDKHTWQPRLDKGMNVLLDSVINGYAGMPPFGMCMDCNAQEFEQLIDFMAKGSS